MRDDSTRPVSRRQFTSTAAMAALSAAIVPSRVVGQDAPRNKLNLAAIGIGGMGASNLKACADENIVALCDVDRGYAAKVIAAFPKAKFYVDYREMLEKETGIDGVIVATPDHTHAAITMAVLRAGKHVYCQKPLTHTIFEARALTEAARKHKVVTQMGNQGQSYDSMRLLKEWLDDGAIGDVTEVHAWTDRPVGGDPWSDFEVRARPKDTPQVPETLDWDRWLGPVAYRPYHPAYHPMKWRAWQDFGTGALGDMGCHILDPAFWALELGPPSTVEATSTHFEPDVASETYPRACIVRYTFPARGSRPPVKLTWTDGRLLPPRPPELEPGRKLPGSGALLIGKQGDHPARLARRRRRAADPRDADAGVYTAAAEAASGQGHARRRLDSRHQGGPDGRSAQLALRVRRRAHRDGAPRRAGDPPEGPAAGVGQQKPAIHQQRPGKRAAEDSLPRGVDALAATAA